jgi:class 3 adenylate cyclase
VLADEVQRGRGEQIDAAIWFCDMRGFTALGERRTPEELVAILDAYFDVVGSAIADFGGEVLKFIGDAVLAIFPISGDPRDACGRAIAEAEQALASLARLNDAATARGEEPIAVGVALHRGPVLYGNIAARDRLDFTVISSAVNTASRLESLCKELAAPLVLSADLVDRPPCIREPRSGRVRRWTTMLRVRFASASCSFRPWTREPTSHRVRRRNACSSRGERQCWGRLGASEASAWRTTMKRLLSLLSTLPAMLVVAGFYTLGAACSSSGNGGTAAPDAATGDSASSTSDSSTGDSATTSDASVVDAERGDVTTQPPDAGVDAELATPTFVAKAGAPTEGLWEISPNASEGVGTTGTPIISSVLAAEVLAAGSDGGTTSFGGVIVDGGASGTYTFGITTDATGNVYYAVAAASASPVPAPGIYKLPSTGGAAVAFALGSSVTPNMNFANGLDFIGANLFVADSEGVIYSIEPSGTATVWSSDSSLLPNSTASGTSPACGFVPLAIGANGIAHDTHNVYVTNTDYGRLIAIPIAANGSAGSPSVLKEDCGSLGGADGLVIDTDGSFVIAVNAQNKIVRVTPSGQVTVLASGAPLATPASVLFDTNAPAGTRRLLVTNTTFFTPADAGLSPGLLAFPVP